MLLFLGNVLVCFLKGGVLLAFAIMLCSIYSLFNYSDDDDRDGDDGSEPPPSFPPPGGASRALPVILMR